MLGFGKFSQIAPFCSRIENVSMTLPVGQSLSIIKILLEELTNNYISRRIGEYNLATLHRSSMI